MGVWIDTKEAIIVELIGGIPAIKKIKSLIESRIRIPGEGKWFTRMGGQFLNFENKKKKKENIKIRRYLTDIIEEIKDSDEVILFGPGGIKSRLEKLMKSHNDLAVKILRVDTADSMTDKQVAARVKEYFKV